MFYFILILLIVLLFLFYSYINRLNKHPIDIQILQTNKYDITSIQNTLITKQPTVIKDIMYEWDIINDIYELNIEQINEFIKNNDKFNDILFEYLNVFSLFLSYNWEYNINFFNTSNTYNYFIKENNHRHLICQITGKTRIYLASYNQEIHLIKNSIEDKSLQFNNIRSTINFWNTKETTKEPFNKLEYIEIIIKEGSILYIPKGWWYLIKIEEPGLLMEVCNISIFNIF